MRKTLSFPKAIHNFMGYLEGSGKALHTIKNYRLDLLAFQKYLIQSRKTQDPAEIEVDDLTRDDLEHYHQHLKMLGLKINTRRRKLLTVQRFLSYLTSRKKLSNQLPRRLSTPHKVERVPFTVPVEQLVEAIRALPQTTELEERNRVLLWVLAETGCQVSEAAQLRYEDWRAPASSGLPARVEVSGKGARSLNVSSDLFDAIKALESRAAARAAPWLFLGFNKHGSLGGAISPRGIELLVRSYAPRLGFSDDLTPRTFRHSRVLGWFKDGVTRDEIQKRLGLKTAYAFRSYEPLFEQLMKPKVVEPRSTEA